MAETKSSSLLTSKKRREAMQPSMWARIAFAPCGEAEAHRCRPPDVSPSKHTTSAIGRADATMASSAVSVNGNTSPSLKEKEEGTDGGDSGATPLLPKRAAAARAVALARDGSEAASSASPTPSSSGFNPSAVLSSPSSDASSSLSSESE